MVREKERAASCMPIEPAFAWRRSIFRIRRIIRISVYGFEAERNVSDVDSFAIFNAPIAQRNKVEGECG
jgi:hypothetical protein